MALDADPRSPFYARGFHRRMPRYPLFFIHPTRGSPSRPQSRSSIFDRRSSLVLLLESRTSRPFTILHTDSDDHRQPPRSSAAWFRDRTSTLQSSRPLPNTCQVDPSKGSTEGWSRRDESTAPSKARGNTPVTTTSLRLLDRRSECNRTRRSSLLPFESHVFPGPSP